MFIDVTETDDPIRYGTSCSPVPLHFPNLTREGKCEGFPAPRGLRAAFSLLGSILLSLSCNTVQMFREIQTGLKQLSRCVQLGHTSQGLLSATPDEAECFLTAPLTSGVTARISLAPKLSVSV